MTELEYSRAQFLIDLKLLGLTQAEFARRLGFNRHFVAQWGAGGRIGMPRWTRHLMRAWLLLLEAEARIDELERATEAQAAIIARKARTE